MYVWFYVFMGCLCVQTCVSASIHVFHTFSLTLSLLILCLFCSISVCSFLFYYCSFDTQRKDMDLEGVEGGEIVMRIYCMKKVYF